jgi:hypothetical protein
VKKGVDARTPHRWYTPNIKGSVSGAAFTHCWRCGLMALKNEATAKAVRAGCFRDEQVLLDVTGPER